MSNNTKMKGLLKGLRYISQIFDNEKEPEIQIGYPTDVKHVAHIGWDGPSVNPPPSWMSEFKSPPGFSSAPLSFNGESKNDNQVKWVSEDSSRKVGRAPVSPGRNLPELPKSSRRQSSTGSSAKSPTREKSEKSRQTRKYSKSSNKDISDSSIPTRKPKDPIQGSDMPTVFDISKTSQRKKSKDSPFDDSSSKLRNRTLSSEGDAGFEYESISKANNSDLYQSFNSLEDGRDQEVTGIS
ncbi:PBD domain-containing protein [Cephalotus follicularis]|uniref:PBD domain-containing protein n=1 Tax=Cephalotus follicularis TaxID=3775 RepID=A0A1Q3CWV2_CEPFO|nr:PBD domain-containing protein [Cephalotus follicularis]